MPLIGYDLTNGIDCTHNVVEPLGPINPAVMEMVVRLSKSHPDHGSVGDYSISLIHSALQAQKITNGEAQGEASNYAQIISAA